VNQIRQNILFSKDVDLASRQFQLCLNYDLDEFLAVSKIVKFEIKDVPISLSHLNEIDDDD